MRRPLMLVASLAMGFAATGCGGGSTSAATLHVAAAEMAFSPSALRGSTGRVTIAVTNRGKISHTFSINAIGAEVMINPAETKTLTIDAVAGTYNYVCRVLDHEGLGMHGALTLT